MRQKKCHVVLVTGTERNVQCTLAKVGRHAHLREEALVGSCVRVKVGSPGSDDLALLVTDVDIQRQ